MRIKITYDSLRKFLERATFFILSFFVAVLLIAAIWELRPFYGYGLDNTIVQVIAQAVLGINGTMFQFSLDIYIWYACAWMFVVVALNLILLVALYFGFLSNLRLNRKHAIRKLFIYFERVSALNIVKSLCRRLMWLFREKGEGLEKRHGGEVASEEVPAKGREWKTYAWQISLILAVALIVFTYRYVIFPVLQGWDTPYYVYMIKSVQLDPTLIARIDIVKLLPIAIMTAITSISGLTAEQMIMLLTPLIGILYMIGVYLLVTTGIKNRLVALLAALYTSLTFGTIRMSTDLYSNFLAWTFAMYALTLYIKTMETKETKLNYIIATAMMFVLTALMHIWSFFFFTAIIFLENFLEILTGGEYRRNIQRTLIVYTPIIIVAILYLNVVAGGLAGIGLFVAQFPFYEVSRENPYILLLAIIGIIAIVKYKGTTYGKIVISWTIVTSTALLTGIFPIPFRIMILVPIAILAAHGTQAISSGIIRVTDSRLTAKPIVPLIFLLCFTAMAPYAYLPEYALRPSNGAMQQLYWIEQHYGFQNNSIVVCFDVIPPSVSGIYYSNYYFWGLATVGDVLYDGLLLYLIQGFPDSHGRSFRDLAGKTIIIPDQFYRMTSIEYGASRRASDLGVYEVQFKTITQIDQIIRNESVWLEDDFEKEEWIPNALPVNYKYQVTNESSILNISVTPLQPEEWFFIQRWLPAPIHPTSHLILKAKGNIDSLDFTVGVLTDTEWLAWTDFSKYMTLGNYTYLDMVLTPNVPASRIRLSLMSGNETGIECYIQVDYVALI